MKNHDTGITSPVAPRQECVTATATPVVCSLRSSKIHDRHLDRLAIVYIRQSTPYQVLNHRESRERQYALVDHAIALGWPRERVVVIDDDQAQMPGRRKRGADFVASWPKLRWSMLA